jgi:FAD/FMN-containing dehydrogenase
MMTDLITREITTLTQELPGLVSMPGEARYATAMDTWARQTGVRPAAIVHCRAANDVSAAIRAARRRGLPLSVRGGGHDWAGRALCDGLVIDLSPMRGVTIAADHRSALIAGGALVSDIVALTGPLDLAAAAGSTGIVGMTGLTLGGGYGPLIGRFGLALDNMMEAEVALADGQIVTAGPEQNAELFWALRGGGGNFGVVTAMRHHLHHLPSVHSGLLVYPFSETKAVLERCSEIAASMPDEFSLQTGIVAGPDGNFATLVIPTWSGAPEEGDGRLAPFLQLGTLLAGTIERKSYAALLSTFDAHIASGLRATVDGCRLPALDGEAIEMFVQAMRHAASPGCALITHNFKGAASRVAADATAFGLRRNHVLVEAIALYSNDLEEQWHREWVRRTRQAFTHALPGGYPNLLGRDEAARAAVSYGPNADRLILAKRRYDPDNVFFSAIPLPQPSV